MINPCACSLCVTHLHPTPHPTLSASVFSTETHLLPLDSLSITLAQVREETEALLHLKQQKEQPRTLESASESTFKPTIITSAPPPPGGPRHSVRGVADGIVVDSVGESGRRPSTGTPHSSGGRDEDDFLVHPSHRHDGVAEGAWSDDESEAVEGLFVPHGAPLQSGQPDHSGVVAHDKQEEVGHCVLVDKPTPLQRSGSLCAC